MNRAIAVFDAGFGSYAIVEAIKKAYPQQDIIYFADRRSFPYGAKTTEELKNIIENSIDFLLKTPAVLLAATKAIAFAFSSCSYLDVSVHCVFLLIPLTEMGNRHQPVGFPHSDIPGSSAYLQLPEAFRRLSRPSSAPSAKASTVRPY